MGRVKRFLRAATIGAAVSVIAGFAAGGGGARAEGARVATVSLHVEGMTCASCKIAVRAALSRLDGVKEAEVDVPKKSATVEYDPAKVTPQQLVDAVNRLGYRASLPANSTS